MTIAQEMVSVLFDKATIEKVKNQFSNNTEIVSVEANDMTFRLFKTKLQNINLELLTTDDKGMYFKVIGYYCDYVKGGFFSSDKLNVIILKEFEEDFKKLNNINKQNLNILFLSLKENALIGAFARETIQKVDIMYNQMKIEMLDQEINGFKQFAHYAPSFDKSLNVNGLNIDLLFSFEGFPQCYLDDDYNVEGAIAVYIKDERGLKLNPTIEYMKDFEKFHKMGLFSAFNSI